jgi:hypothetical protein
MLGGKLGKGAGITPVSVESKKLRDRAAQQLQARRQAKDRSQKAIHEDRAASFKEMAHNEEWLSGDRERSRVIAQLSVKQCMEEARRCRALARKVMTEPHRIMLNHIAATWDRIATDIGGAASAKK